jgi:hypothetical protein
MEKLVKTHEMRGTRLGRLALLSPFGRDGRASASEGKGVGLGEGEGPVPACRLEHFEMVFFELEDPSPCSSLLLQGDRRQNAPVWVSVPPASTRSSLKFRCKNRESQ